MYFCNTQMDDELSALAAEAEYKQLRTRLLAKVNFKSVLEGFKVSAPMAIAFLSRSSAILARITPKSGNFLNDIFIRSLSLTLALTNLPVPRTRSQTTTAVSDGESPAHGLRAGGHAGEEQARQRAGPGRTPLARHHRALRATIPVRGELIDGVQTLPRNGMGNIALVGMRACRARQRFVFTKR